MIAEVLMNVIDNNLTFTGEDWGYITGAATERGQCMADFLHEAILDYAAR